MTYEKIKTFLATHAVCVAVTIACICVCIGIGSVHNNGSGADNIRNELDAAGRDQSEITTGIDSVKSRAGRVAERVEDAQQRVDNLAGGIKDAGEIIGECKQILAGIRARGEKD